MTTNTSSTLRLAAVVLLIAASSGCSTIAHYAQPHQWRKLNYGDELGTDTYNFSIPEPPAARQPEPVDRNVALDLPRSSDRQIQASHMHD